VRDIEARSLVRRLHSKMRQAALPQPDMQRLGASFGEAFSEWVAQLTAALGTMTSASRSESDAETLAPASVRIKTRRDRLSIAPRRTAGDGG